ncbi:MAG TPA: hypothetical protein DDE71_07720, partial [Tenacibaculum sp.]|nr:hypothetical protein [Tenacibaculum sp.]
IGDGITGAGITGDMVGMIGDGIIAGGEGVIYMEIDGDGIIIALHMDMQIVDIFMVIEEMLTTIESEQGEVIIQDEL